MEGRESIRSIVVKEPGGPEVLVLEERPLPEPDPGEVRVRVEAFGVNRADLIQRRGRYPAPPGVPPDVPGLEYAGRVEALGAEVEGWAPGDRVMGIVAGGAYAEALVTNARTLLRVPEGLGPTEAAAIPEVFLTAFDAVVLQGGLRAGESLLVHAVGSGVGTAAVQIARRVGARTVGTSRTPEKLDRARVLGLDIGISAAEGPKSWVEPVLAATGGEGVDLILDLVGGAYAEGNQQVLGQLARWIVVGVPSGPQAWIDLRRLMGARAILRGTVLRARSVEEKAELTSRFAAEALPGLEDGTLVPVVDQVLPAAEIARAHELLEENVTFGKVVLFWMEDHG